MGSRSQGAPWRRYLRFWRRDIAADVDDELEFHFENRIADLTEQGLAPDAARARAESEFGDADLIRQQLCEIDTRVARRKDFLESLRDTVGALGYAARSLARAPALAVTVTLTLATGFGLNAALWTFLDRVFLRPPPGIAAPGGVRRLWTSHTVAGDRMPYFVEELSYHDARALASVLGGDGELAIYQPPARYLVGWAQYGPRFHGQTVSANYFSVLRARAERGRFFTPEEDRPGAGLRVAVISDAYWRAHYGGDESIIGKRLQIGGSLTEYAIVGIAARPFAGIDLQPVDVWLPIGAYQGSRRGSLAWWQSRRELEFRAIVRLASNVEAPLVEERFTAFERHGEPLDTVVDTGTRIVFGAINEAAGPGRPTSEISIATRLAGVAVLVLLVAGANVVNLLLARAVDRRREIALRLALGISRERLVRLLTAESVLLALVAAAAALLMAHGGGTLLRRLLLPSVSWSEPVLHWRVVGFTLALAVAVGTVVGLVPALRASQPDLAADLKEGARESGVHRSRLRRFLVASQAALSVVLLVGAALCVRSLRNVEAIRIGFDADRLLFANMMGDDQTPQPEREAIARMLAERLRALPGADAVARTSTAPMSGVSTIPFFRDRDSVALGRFQPSVTAVSADFFRTTGRRILRGATWLAEGAGTERALAVDQSAASALWPGEDPLGRCIRFVSRDSSCYIVRAVVEPAHRRSVIESGPAPMLYVPVERVPSPWLAGETLVIRTRPELVPALSARVRDAIRAAVPGGSPYVRAMHDGLAPDYRPWKLGATLFTCFGALALLVAVIGIYGAVAYGVAQRGHEFAVRRALGARLGDVVRQVVGESMRTVMVGLAAGIGLALAGGRFVASLLYDIAPTDLGVMLTVSLVLLVVSAVAAAVPARRAACVDPAKVLRGE